MISEEGIPEDRKSAPRNEEEESRLRVVKDNHDDEGGDDADDIPNEAGVKAGRGDLMDRLGGADLLINVVLEAESDEDAGDDDVPEAEHGGLDGRD